MAAHTQLAPWVPMFTQSCKNSRQAFIPFQFSTVAESIDGRAVPKCRTVVFRDFLFNQKQNNVLTFNTDLRSTKIEESFHAGHDTCLFEACFYFNETWEQYRFTGECFLVSRKDNAMASKETLLRYGVMNPEIHEHRGSNESVSFENRPESPMRPGTDPHDNHHDDGEEVEESVPTETSLPSNEQWRKEITRQWETLSRSTKSVYKKPAPGQLLTDDMKAKIDKIERGVDGSKPDSGLDNFAIICMCIDKVDYLNLKGGRGGARWICERIIDETGFETWEEQEVCP